MSKGQAINIDHSDRLFRELGINPQDVAQNNLREAIEKLGPAVGDPAVRNTRIKITTIPSAKGLAEDYVFIIDFDDRFFLEKDGKCSDQKIFDFLVALTRARKKVYLISCDAKEPKFLTWIENQRVERITIREVQDAIIATTEQSAHTSEIS